MIFTKSTLILQAPVVRLRWQLKKWQQRENTLTSVIQSANNSTIFMFACFVWAVKMGGWGSLLTLAIVIGLLKSFPPCIRNPHGVVGSCLSSFASKVRSDILSRVTTSTKYLSTESRPQHKLVFISGTLPYLPSNFAHGTNPLLPRPKAFFGHLHHTD